MPERDFNRLKPWIQKHAKRLNLSMDMLGYKCRVSRTVLYNYMSDEDRPTTQTMKKMCEVFDVPFEEGLSQYTPRKMGRPAGSKSVRKSHVRRKKQS